MGAIQIDLNKVTVIACFFGPGWVEHDVAMGESETLARERHRGNRVGRYTCTMSSSSPTYCAYRA
jgi:hypothetical protein